MINRRLKALCLIPAFAAGICFSAPPPAPVEIVASQFGLFDATTPDELSFEPTNVVPRVEGQRYGWVIEVKTNKRNLSVREEYLIPLAAKPSAEPKDEFLEGFKTPPQRRNQVSQRQLVPVDGKIYGEWSVGKNEPAGHRHLQVFVEGQLAASFEYDVR